MKEGCAILAYYELGQRASFGQLWGLVQGIASSLDPGAEDSRTYNPCSVWGWPFLYFLLEGFTHVTVTVATNYNRLWLKTAEVSSLLVLKWSPEPQFKSVTGSLLRLQKRNPNKPLPVSIVQMGPFLQSLPLWSHHLLPLYTCGESSPTSSIWRCVVTFREHGESGMILSRSPTCPCRRIFEDVWGWFEPCHVVQFPQGN